MIYDLVPSTAEVLREPCVPFDFNNPELNAEELAESLLETMEAKNGIGLAANQIGLPYRVFAVKGDPFVCFNPRIVDTSDGTKLLEEGCLTYPGLYVKIKRPTAIRVRFQNYKGETLTEKYTGLTARIIQHEIGHLDGEVFFNKASRFHRDQAMRRWQRNTKGL